MNNGAFCVSKRKTKYHAYVLTFDYNKSKVDLCRKIKETHGWKEMSYDFDKKEWLFSNLSFLDIFEQTAPVELDIDTALDRSFHKKEASIPVTTVPDTVNELLVSCRKEVESMENGGITLRPYQVDALTNMLYSVRAELPGNDIVVAATGMGKSILIACFARLLNEDVLIIQPGKEILTQNLEKLSQYVDRSDIGIYSASMGEKEIRKYTFATIGSIYKKANFFKHFKYVLIDEAHFLSPKDSGTMFQKFFKIVQPKKILGLTATPYRIAPTYSKDKWGNLISFTAIQLINRMGNPPFWKRIIFNLNIGDLINQRYLCPLEYLGKPIFKHDELRLNKSKTDFDLEYFQKVSLQHEPEILQVVNYAASISKHVLVFCASVAEAISFSMKVPNSAYVSAKTPKKERDKIIDDFKTGKIKIVFNVGILLLGFDMPKLDAIVCNRPTKSIVVHAQMLGRGVRKAQGKTSCKVFDLTSNIASIGRIETIRIVYTNGKWDLKSETCESWHGKILYENTPYLHGK